MSEMTKDDRGSAGWGFLIILLTLAWFITLVMQFFGSQWYWPWIFFAGLIAVSMHSGKRKRGRETAAPVDKKWVRLKYYTDYEIHSETHLIRNFFTKEIIDVGYDPLGLNAEPYVELLNSDGYERYVQLDRVVRHNLDKP